MRSWSSIQDEGGAAVVDILSDVERINDDGDVMKLDTGTLKYSAVTRLRPERILMVESDEFERRNIARKVSTDTIYV